MTKKVYILENGERLEGMTTEEAHAYMAEKGVTWTRIILGDPLKSRPLVMDGSAWRPHYNKTLGKYYTCRKAYDRDLKARGLVEVGNEKFTPSYTPPTKKLMDDDAINFIRDKGSSVDESVVKEINDLQ